MVRAITLFTTMVMALGLSSACCAVPEESLARGKLLYATHCVSCHSVEMHWREKKLASNWSSLKFQVDRWQKAAGLGWEAEDIEQVSAYLNVTYYHFPAQDRVGLETQGSKIISVRQ
jgi:mono/diheme cytochrome c family protein